MDKSKAEADVAFIKQVIEESKNKLAEYGLPYIIFGAMAVLGTGLSYGAGFGGLAYVIPWIWIVLGVAAAVSVVVFLTRRAKKNTVSFAGRLYSIVWTGTGFFDLVVCLCLFAAGCSDLRIYMIVVAGSLGMAYFISSTITRNRGMFVLSFFWWAGCLPMGLMDALYAPLVLAGLTLGCELIPGIILHTRSTRQRKNAANAA